MTETELFEIIKNRILTIQQNKHKPILVAINGIEGTGKTNLVITLAKYLKTNSLFAIHVSIDGFHNTKAIRYKQGKNSAIGYYEDSYNELTFVDKVLKASQAETPNYTSAIHDLETDAILDLEPITISNKTIIIVDGAYLFKPNYINYWDLKIYLKTDFKTAMQRGAKRDANLLGDFLIATEKYKKRYHKASKFYIAENNPENQADIVVDNTNFNNLRIISS